MGEQLGSTLVCSACIAYQLDVVEEAQDGYLPLGNKRLGPRLYGKSFVPLWDFPCNMVIILLRLVLKRVRAMIHCGHRFFVDGLEHLKLRIFSGFVVCIKAAVGSAVGKTFTSFRL